MTIAFVCEIFLPIVNGVVTTTIDLAENLKKRGHKVLFIVPSWSAFQEPEIHGVPIHYVPSIPTHMYPGIRFVSPWNTYVSRIVKQEHVDIMHITGPWLLSWSAIKAAHTHNIPLIHTFHTLIYEDNYLYYGLHCKPLIPLLRVIVWKYIGLFVNRSDVMTAPSQHACNTLQAHFPDTRVEHIRNGIDLSEFETFHNYETLKQKYPQFNHKTFIFVGRLGEEKSVSVLIEAFRKAYLKDSELRLFIIGDGPSRHDYERTVEEQNLHSAVNFLGRLPHDELLHSGLYQHARALVTASTTENQPITVIEAIACKTPIIIPNVEGIKELLFKNGRAFPAGDTDAFADEILEMAHNDELFHSCTRESETLRQEFDGNNVAEQFEQLYESARLQITNEVAAVD